LQRLGNVACRSHPQLRLLVRLWMPPLLYIYPALIQAILNTALRIEAWGNQWLSHFASGKQAGPKNMRVESRTFALRAMIVGDALDEFSFFEEGDFPRIVKYINNR